MSSPSPSPEGEVFLSRAKQWPHWIPLLVIAFGYVASRLYAYHAGVRFDGDSIRWAYQFLDPLLLVDDAKRSLLYLESQPPLFNLYLSVVLKVFGESANVAFAATFRLLGVVLAVSSYGLAIKLGANRVFATVATLLIIASPTAIVYEHWLFYTWPVVVLICVAAWAYSFVAKKPMIVSMVVLGASLVALVGTRSVFHLLWLCCALAPLLLIEKQFRKKVIVFCAITIVIAGSFFIKNALLFGSFSVSSWMGMSLSKVVVAGTSEDRLVELIHRNDVDPILGMEPFETISKYNGFYEPSKPDGIPARDDEFKSNGFPNMNHRDYAAVNSRYKSATLQLMRFEPLAHLRGAYRSLIIFLKPASEYLFLAENCRLMFPYERFYNAIVNGKIGEHTYVKKPDLNVFDDRKHQLSNIGFFVPVVFLVAVGFLVFQIVRRARDRQFHEPLFLLHVFLLFTIVWVTLLGVCIEYGENNRFRYQIEPIIWVVFAAAVSNLFKPQEEKPTP